MGGVTPAPTGAALAAEAARQQALLGALLAGPVALPPQARALPGPPRAAALAGRRGAPLPPAPPAAAASPPPPAADALAGLRAYRANAQAAAERALAAAHPVIAQLLGDEAVAALARDLWREQPPRRGDLAHFGGGLGDWLPGIAEWAGMPWLADVARLEWALHAAQGAADADTATPRLARLGTDDPARLRASFVPGTAALASTWPVLAIWRAHQVPPGAAPDLADARAALAAGRGEAVWLWRRGLGVELAALDPADHAFGAALLAGVALGPALDHTLEEAPHFSFEAWLARALREGWLAGFDPMDDPDRRPA